jgi:hypothetical protein
MASVRGRPLSPPPPLPSLSLLRATLVSSLSTHVITAVARHNLESSGECSICFLPGTDTGMVDVGCDSPVPHLFCPECIRKLVGVWITPQWATAPALTDAYSRVVPCPYCRENIWKDQSAAAVNAVLVGASDSGTRRARRPEALKALVKRIVVDLWPTMRKAHTEFVDTLLAWTQKPHDDDVWQSLTDRLCECIQLEHTYVKDVWLPWLDEWAATPNEVQSHELARKWNFARDSAATHAFVSCLRVSSVDSIELGTDSTLQEFSSHMRTTRKPTVDQQVQLELHTSRVKAVEPPWAKWTVRQPEVSGETVTGRVQAFADWLRAWLAGESSAGTQDNEQLVTLGGSTGWQLHPHTRILVTSPFDLWRYLREMHEDIASQWAAWAVTAEATAVRYDNLGSDHWAPLLVDRGPHTLQLWERLLLENDEETELRGRYARRQTLLREWYDVADSAGPDAHYDTLVIRTIERNLNRLRDVNGDINVETFAANVARCVTDALNSCEPPWVQSWGTTWHDVRDPAGNIVHRKTVHEDPAYDGPNSTQWIAWEKRLRTLQEGEREGT